MTEDRIIAAILAAGVLAGSQKSVPAGRAVMTYNDILVALASSQAPVIEQRAEPRRNEEPRVQWLNNGNPT